MYKKILIAILLWGGVITFIACARNQKTDLVMFMPNLNNGDAKFFNENIITSINGQLTLIDIKGNIMNQYEQIKANWIDTIENERIVIYGNFDKEIGIAKFDENYQLLSNHIVMHTNNLQIDPTIIKVKDSYYATMTEIEGNINNADLNNDNGIYTIHLYKSDNLLDWNFISNIRSEKYNLEDVETLYSNNHFSVIYEQEVVDKGKSAVYLIESIDAEGKAWNNPKVLLEATCDHEPAKVISIGNEYELYYSCDKKHPGESYLGAKMYYAQYDKDFNLKKQDIEIPSITQKGILLYDVKKLEDKIQFLFAGNYLTDFDLIVEER